MTPEIFRFGFGENRLGTALVALSSRGVAAILLGEDRSRLLRELKDAFPAGAMIEDREACRAALSRLAAFLAAPEAGLDLPLDPRGSELEQAVWAALREIPAGATRSYGALARQLPLPATAQEIGAACAANKLAIAIPCHRVVKADGSISGYRWGCGASAVCSPWKGRRARSSLAGRAILWQFDGANENKGLGASWRSESSSACSPKRRCWRAGR